MNDSKARLKSQDQHQNSTAKKSFTNKVQDMVDPHPDRVIQVNYDDIDNKLQSQVDDVKDFTGVQTKGLLS